jgi:hypothetical protein
MPRLRMGVWLSLIIRQILRTNYCSSSQNELPNHWKEGEDAMRSIAVSLLPRSDLLF